MLSGTLNNINSHITKMLILHLFAMENVCQSRPLIITSLVNIHSFQILPPLLNIWNTYDYEQI